MYVFLTSFFLDNSRPVALNENIVCGNLIRFLQPNSCAVKYTPVHLAWTKWNSGIFLLEGNQFYMKNCSFEIPWTTEVNSHAFKRYM